MPNAFAYLVFYTWPLVAILLFVTLPRVDALVWTIMAGFFLLPNGVALDLPLVPTIDKHTLPTLSASLALLLRVGIKKRRHRDKSKFSVEEATAIGTSPFRFIFNTLIGIGIFGAFITVLTNSEPVNAGPLVLPGLQMYDAFSVIGGFLFNMLPFLLARKYISTSQDHHDLLRILVIISFVYSAPVLWELRMSPQLHNQIYGFFPHSFFQHIRSGGWRPVVFMNHGLMLGITLTMACVASIGLWKSSGSKMRSKQCFIASIWIFFVLVLSKNLGAVIIAIVFVPLFAFCGRRVQVLFATLVACIVIVYPFARSIGIIPTERVVSFAERIDQNRADSLSFRLSNEDLLMARASEKPVGGWGGWGRNRVHNEYGEDVSVTDGIWVIIIGGSGWIGYFSQFGILCLPLLCLAFRPSSATLPTATIGVALILTANLIDMIPNASLTPLTWLCAGAIAGFLARSYDAECDRTVTKPNESRNTPNAAGSAVLGQTRSPVYSRFRDIDNNRLT